MNVSKKIILSLGIAALLNSLVSSASAQDPFAWPTPDSTAQVFYLDQFGNASTPFGTANEYFADSLLRIFYGSGDMMQITTIPSDVILNDDGSVAVIKFYWSSYNTQGYGPARADMWISTGSGELEAFTPGTDPFAPPGAFLRIRQTWVVTSTFPTTTGYAVQNQWSYITVLE